MEFEVKFASTKGNIVETVGGVGLDILDAIRKDHPKYNDMESKRISIDMSCPVNGSVYRLKLDEETARNTGLFGARQEVAVRVPEYGLSGFSRFVPVESNVTEITSEAKWILGVRFGYKEVRKLAGVTFKNKIDNKELLRVWIKHGCPLEWEPNRV